ncbi:MAG: protein kinase domain-containing protein, partial [Planctomycetota bacterium]
MPELFVETGPLKGKHCPFGDAEAFVIGSDQSCNLELDGPGVATRHLVIKALKNGGFGVKKLEGGFLLNGRETQAARLAKGDILDIGATRLRFGPAREPEQDNEEPQKGNGTLGGFRLFEVLGKGGMGTVYRAEQVSLHRQVALKALKKELTKDPVFVARFVAEARAAARLSHPNVVQVIDVGHDGDTYYLSMELMQASSLEHRLRAGGAIPVAEALQMIADAAEGLAYAESLRIVHCDIKPDNLMLDHHGTVKIADLGLAMTDEDNLTKLVGTPHFMSPEQVLRKPMDHRSDLYSLGCTFYRLLTGKTPFKGATVKNILRAQLKEDPEPPHRVNPEVPSVVGDIVLKLLRKDPDDRYQSATELLAAIHHVQSPPARKGLMIAGATALVLLAGGAIWWAATQDPERIIIHGNNGQPDPEMQRKLRESNAKAAFYEVLIDRKLTSAQVIARLRAVAKDYAGTEAAKDAAKTASGIEEEEKKKAAEIARHRQAVDNALKRLQERVNPLLAKDDFRAVADVLKKPDLDPKLSSLPEIKQALRNLRDTLRKQANQKLNKLKAVTDAALKNRDPDAVLASLPPLEAVMDKHKGWPREVLAD